MKAISLTQPWATLVAIGAKKIETRSWYTVYRGPIAIHAAKGFPKWAKDLACCALFSSYLGRGGFPGWKHLPLGSVVATARLVTCRLVVDTQQALGPCADTSRMLPPQEPERSFGDYTTGRFAWILDEVKPLAEPVPVKGALGLWEWSGGSL